jgi:hypothetical protein
MAAAPQTPNMRRFRAAYAEVVQVQGLTSKEIFAIRDVWRAEREAKYQDDLELFEETKRRRWKGGWMRVNTS